MKEKWNIAMPAVMMVLFALSRWPGLMPENFSAVYGLVFCAAVYFPGKLAWFLPLVTLLVTDVIMNLFYYHADLVSGYMLVNYLAYGGILWLGRQFSARSSWLSLLSGGLLGAILFYLVTNTAAWMQNPEYAKTLAGWIQALTIGTPGWPHTWEFFRNTLLSGGLFTGLFAGAMKLSEAAEEAEQAEEEGETAAEPKEPKTEEAEA